MPKSLSTTIGDLETEACGILSFHSKLGPDSRVSDHDALIWTAHHRPPIDTEMPLSALGNRWDILKTFYQTPQGNIVRRLGNIQGDLGSTEISEGIFQGLSQTDFNPLWVYPSLGGRVGVDWNRPTGSTMVKMPDHIEAAHIEMNKHGIDLLYRIATKMAQRVKVVLQPHTMASGEFDPSEKQKAIEMLKNCNPNASDYTNSLETAVDATYKLDNTACNNGEPRPDCDIPTGYDDDTILPDSGLSTALMRELKAIGIVSQFNNPFSHVQGYPGSELIEIISKHRRAIGLPAVRQAAFDIAKRHIADDTRFDAISSGTNKLKIDKIVQAVINAISY